MGLGEKAQSFTSRPGFIGHSCELDQERDSSPHHAGWLKSRSRPMNSIFQRRTDTGLAGLRNSVL